MSVLPSKIDLLPVNTYEDTEFARMIYQLVARCPYQIAVAGMEEVYHLSSLDSTRN